MKNKKKIIINFIVLILAVIVFLIFAEILCRIFYDESSNFEDVVWQEILKSKERLISKGGNSLKESKYINKSNGLRYRLIDNKIDEDSYARFDINVVKKEKEKDIFRIVVLGDSFTRFGGLENKDDMYTTQLSEILNNFLTTENGNYFRFEVLAFSDGGLNTFQEAELLKNLALAYNPNILILQYTDNDVIPPRTEFGNAPKGNLFIDTKTNVIVTDNFVVPTFPFLNMEANCLILEKSNFLRFVAYKMYLVKVIGEVEGLEGENKSLASLKEISSIAKEKNIPFILINFASASSETNFCSNFSGKGIPNPLYAKLKDLSQQLNFYYINMCEQIDDINLLKSNIEDNCVMCHYNKLGHEVAAKALANEIFEIINKDI